MAKTIRLRSLLAKYFNVSNSEAERMIGEGRVRVDGKAEGPSFTLEEWHDVSVDGKSIRPAKSFVYFLFFKPRGTECTMSASVENNLRAFFPGNEDVFPVGRLDKDSEGLLLVTNDGRLFSAIAGEDSGKEKEYVVSVDKEVNADFIRSMSQGVVIMGKKTKPAKVFAAADPFSFRIILTQGLNRQIRRMCYKLGFNVTRLVRTRIDVFTLGEMKPGEIKVIGAEKLESN
ncbi:MAG TPA: pseudouridine synthase [Bacteroidia bacterium]|nr:pseudouridine synthase [Bacteroidia bacterium]